MDTYVSLVRETRATRKVDEILAYRTYIPRVLARKRLLPILNFSLYWYSLYDELRFRYWLVHTYEAMLVCTRST
jgi:hypothetical protein